MLIAFFLVAEIYLSDATIYLSNLTATCESIVIHKVRENFKFRFGSKTLNLSVENTNIRAEKISGYIFNRYFEADFFELRQGDLMMSDICISLCGLTCPKGGVFGDMMIEKNRIKLASSGLKFFNIKIPALLISRKFDVYGRSPGFIDPTFSFSRRSGNIFGIGYLFPFRSFDLLLSTLYFRKNGLFLAGVGAKDIDDERFSFDVMYADQSVFSGKYSIIVHGGEYFFSSYADLFTEGFIRSVPAKVERSSFPFGSVGQESFVELRTLAVSSYMRTFSFFLTGYESFTRIIVTYGRDSFLSLGGIAHISSSPLRTRGSFLPLAKFLYSAENFTIGVRVFPIDGVQVFHPYERNSGREVETSFLPYESYLYIFSEDFIYPNLFFLSYTRLFDIGLGLTGTYVALSFFKSDMLMKDREAGSISLIPESGLSIVSGNINLFLSGGLKRTNSSDLFSDSGVLISLGDLGLELRNSIYAERFLVKTSSSHRSSLGSVVISNEIAFLISNSSVVFGDTETKKDVELFPLYKLSLMTSSFGLQSGFILHNLRFVQLSLLLSYHIRKMCTEIYLDGVYNFTKVGEPRISFGAKVHM